MKGKVIAVAASSVAVAVAAFMIVTTFGTSEQYAIDVDPFKDPQGLFTTARVTIHNTGRAPLTNVIVDYEGHTDKIPVLKPGEKLIMSPPSGNALKQVTVTCDEGLHVTKPYRTPTKMPGMMGS